MDTAQGINTERDAHPGNYITRLQYAARTLTRLQPLMRYHAFPSTKLNVAYYNRVIEGRRVFSVKPGSNTFTRYYNFCAN